MNNFLVLDILLSYDGFQICYNVKYCGFGHTKNFYPSFVIKLGKEKVGKPSSALELHPKTKIKC
jgi:hypothetical protein